MAVAKNTMYYTFALLYQKILGFVYFTLIARFLGVDESGRYFFAISFATLFAIFADLGLAPVLIREVAKNKENINLFFSKILSLKFFISLFTVFLIWFFAFILGYDQYTRSLVYVSMFVVFFDSFSLVFWALFRGVHNLKYESIGVLVIQTLTVSLGSYALIKGHKADTIIYILLLSSIVYFLMSAFFVFKKMRIKVELLKPDRQALNIFKMSLPFALAGVFSKIYTQIDTVMISKIGCIADECARNVGWYAISTKTTLAMQFIPLALTASLYPMFSKLYKEKNTEKIIEIYTNSYRYLLILSGFIVAVILSLSTPLIEVVWGREFLMSSVPMKFLMVSVVFLFLTFPNGSFLNASGYQKTNTYFMGVSVVLNIVLNSFLIYFYGIIGASVASLVSTFSLFVMGFVKVYRLIRFNVYMIFMHMFKTFIAIGIVTALMYLGMGYINIFVLMILSGVLYLSLLLALREISFYDIKKILGTMKI